MMPPKQKSQVPETREQRYLRERAEEYKKGVEDIAEEEDHNDQKRNLGEVGGGEVEDYEDSDMATSFE